MRRIIGMVRDAFEIHLPAVVFLTMFFSFILQVFSNFVLDTPLSWIRDVIVLCFVWIVLFGACYTMRSR